ncbi:hypothetical protein PROFUN_09859 [Planoprotostelium fungivorum]|uniref:VPS35 endosomal protein sorting factor-like n=1 Tax=Planoprotostelium fungivorum TaxID=1890364 RepID=A0A2P6NFP4_9EUKA|nr:hypothetical protein PROFUN_09859 [Planoprotostelium fungivorum]
MATPAPYWVPLERDDRHLKSINSIKSKSTIDHPLVVKSVVETKTIEVVSKEVKSPQLAPKKNSTEKNGVSNNDPLSAVASPTKPLSDPLSSDPLSASALVDPLSSNDPLSMSAQEPQFNYDTSASRSSSNLTQFRGKSATMDKRSTMKKKEQQEAQEKWDEATRLREQAVTLWKTKKAGILQEFTTDELMGVTASFIDESESGKAKVTMDKTQMRLAQLEEGDTNTAKNTQQLSQKEFEKKIESYHSDIMTSWKSEEKVKALKVAIQGAKMLTDTSTIKFYPSKFVLITEILDTFGNLVYERISSKHGPGDKPSEQARETCRNWFHKIASVRELVPRIYIEMAILRCYIFIQQKTFPIVIERLCRQIRGIGDPLVAMYARSYLVRKGNEVEPDLKVYAQTAFEDFVTHHTTITSEPFVNSLERYHITKKDYLHLYYPAVDWIFTCMSTHYDQADFDRVLDGYRRTKDSIILESIVTCLDSTMIVLRAEQILQFIYEDDKERNKILGLTIELLNSYPCNTSLNEGIVAKFNEYETTIEDDIEAVTLLRVFVEFSARYTKIEEVNQLLGRVLARGKKGAENDQLMAALQSVIVAVLDYVPSTVSILSMDCFPPLVELMKGEREVSISKSILNAFSKGQETLKDPVIIGNMFTLATNVHDSMNSLSFFDEIRQNSRSIATFINRVDFGIDLEKHLNFHVECRKAFGNLDMVKHQLVLSTLQLCMKALKIVKGKHNKKTAQFARACISYCYITIPTMEDALVRLKLYIFSGQIALLNQSLPQVDALFKSAIILIQEVPTRITELHNQGQSKSTEPVLMEYIESLFSSLVVVPGHPEAGPFYLIKALLKVIAEYPWENGSVPKTRVYIQSLSLLSAQYQTRLPYSIVGVDGNDKLYGGDNNFRAELQEIINRVVDDILKELSGMPTEESHNQVEQSRLSLEMFNSLLSYAQLTPRSATLAVKLYELVKKGGKTKYAEASVNSLRSHTTQLSRDLYNKLVSL